MRTLASILFVLCCASADANPKPNTAEAAAHVERAAKAHREGKFEVALDELEAAYALEPQAKLLFAMAQVHAKLDNCEAAIDHYEQFLVAETDRSKQDVVRQAIDACKQRLADKADPTVERTPPADDKSRPPVEPGPPPTSVSSQVPAPDPLAAATRAERSPWYTDVVGDTLVVAGVGAAVGSLVAYRSARGALDDAEAAPMLEGYREHRDSAERKQVLAIALAGGGLALVTAGVLRFALRDDARETRSVAVVPTRGGGLVTWGGGF